MATQTAPIQPGVSCRHHQENGRHVFVVCMGEQCAVAGSSRLLAMLKKLTRQGGQNVRISASRTCIGHCAAAPAMVENGRILRWMSLRRLRGELLRLGIH